MYIEKGTVYGELDENLNMKYSNQERAKLFEENLPLPDYLNLVSFFLRQSIELMSSYTESKKIRKSLLKTMIGLFGRN
jgi:formate dehydrogenase maturation protein FdhE